ncbi:endonuclease/exonuclease/phosphatase family protein [Streptomyces rishiriensis]|uniref:Endonuclease/exonuclease/phosphatase (EEP) superfamily protein YafD n=1 Tax=Streptomyces rishiriensis TaxID=68264 RepID=A0ABU0NU87_STRRH|nr:endonuclease/exonuclease/phosphatase family protein [Streptomyces rishiriensis]MDQ0582283.1 endonuclease/exonuclease/phosphatase (EEP) superfamily protein YafD [Streptomyces rishiriensis]
MRSMRGRLLGARCAGLSLAGVSVVVGCRVADTDAVTPVPQLLAFLPWLLVPTGAAVVLSLLARWPAGLIWGAVVLGLLARFVEPYGTAGRPDGPALARLRVLTSNVEFGWATDALIPLVRRENPDIVFVEECEYTCQAAVRKDLGAAYPYRQAVEGDSSVGSVILSRFPLTATAGVPGSMGMPGAVADVGGRAVRLQLAHPKPPLPRQVSLWKEELGRLRDFAARHESGPLVLAGDFNASQDHAVFRRILGTGLRDAARLSGDAREPSWPSRTAPAFGAQIDHVLVSRDFAASGARFLHLDGTDHRTLVVDITLHQGRSHQG